MTASRFSAVGLPEGPNMRIRLLGDRPSAAPTAPRGHRKIHHATQSVTINPGTRENSRLFAVTRVAPRRRAWAAIR